MALETLSSNELLNFIIYDTISATPLISTSTTCNNNNNDYSSSDTITTTTATAGAASTTHVFLNNPAAAAPAASDEKQMMMMMMNNNGGGQQQAKKKRRRRPRVCKNKEEAENQRMTHIAVERNRRKQMNEHLAVLRSLMPESYVQRGDQASIVGGAIEFVKELEHLLQSLEAQKFIITRQRKRHHRDHQQEQQEQEEEEEVLSNIEHDYINNNDINAVGMINMLSNHDEAASPPLFSQFFSYPQYTYSQIPNKHTSKSKAAMADIEVTLIETHANLRILSRKRLTQLSKMVACFQTLYLSILHLNVTTLDPFVLYSISTKVEEGCRLNSADEIAGAVNQMLRIIEEESTLC